MTPQKIAIFWGVIVGMAIVFMYAVLGGMKGITYTQVAQYCVLIFAYLVPAIFISMLITGIPVPQIGLGAEVADGSGLSVLDKLDQTLTELGFAAYTQGGKSTIDVFAITMALMIGTGANHQRHGDGEYVDGAFPALGVSGKAQLRQGLVKLVEHR